MKPIRVHYPWPSLLGALMLIGWQYSLANPAFFVRDDWPAWSLQADNLPLAAAGLCLLIAFDIWRFVRASARCRRQLEQYQAQIGELFDSKRELGTRARTYSDHADKLKMFISERLLEYIEYDEKFLHFKNIASEVRHNGVISYDKAQTALTRAQQICDKSDVDMYREAAEGLLYLWDLLDLSTTDNLALHVANQIYDCEEHYFQAMLNEADEAAPFNPTFMMSHALRRALLPITDDVDQLGLNGDWPKRGIYADDKFTIRLGRDSEMLGNENHMVLLIENLLNNALFYSQQKGYKSRHSNVAISLGQQDREVLLQVYNRGPHIDEDEKDRIYQLGFSSRRIREHHGKGLGLYFVNEITKGFEGSIGFENLDNQEDSFSLSVKLTNGELHQQRIDIAEINGKPMCREGDESSPVSKRAEWSYPAPVASVEISRAGARKPQLISELGLEENRHHRDAADPLLARWILEVRNRKRSSRLVFLPIDVRGVQFSARFTGADARLDSQY